ncbi:MAG: hypothetical protein L0Y36_08185 [Planctomycetales bacterium]|nr:hypothetical protein [Planctomycetales bacterium]
MKKAKAQKVRPNQIVNPPVRRCWSAGSQRSLSVLLTRGKVYWVQRRSIRLPAIRICGEHKGVSVRSNNETGFLSTKVVQNHEIQESDFLTPSKTLKAENAIMKQLGKARGHSYPRKQSVRFPLLVVKHPANSQLGKHKAK